ncbi:nitrilase-related carbon-nitrogen hydrolase, partial [Mycolicibacter hiberniae]|uniref:nitrilase-related carbon-nitrogen hydrolase n=1 Tax=Mycolicibacter hiberniae TaxID=29314 RepID=UPI0023DF6B3A
MTVIRAALTQATWTGDKESMLVKHERFVAEAASRGAQVICFQELFYGPYFGIVQDKKYYGYAEPVPGPVTERFAALARQHQMVMVLPVSCARTGHGAVRGARQATPDGDGVTGV